MDYVINTINEKNTYFYLDQRSYTSNKVRKYLAEKFNKDFFVFLDDEGMFVLQSLVNRDWKSGYLNVLAMVEDVCGVYPTGVFHIANNVEDEDDMEDADNSIRINTISFYNDFNVAYVRYFQYVERNAVEIIHLLLAPSKEEFEKFIEYGRKFLLDSRQDTTTIYTDTSKGQRPKTVVREKKITRDDVLIPEETKTEIFRTIDQFFAENGEFYKKYNIPYRRGILLYGQPGNGKTTLINAIVSEMQNTAVIYWQVTEYTTSETIAEIFKRVTYKRKNCLLIIEDIDSLPERSRSIFLNMLDGYGNKFGTFIIATTNYPEKIDSAVMNRAGRFDKTYLIPKPNQEARREYLIRKGILELVSNDILIILALDTQDFSMATLNEVYTMTALQKHYEGEVTYDAAKKIVKDIKDIADKQKKRNFKETESTGLGFIRD